MRIFETFLHCCVLLLLVFAQEAYAAESDDRAKIPATLLATALNHAVQSGLGEDLVQEVVDKKVDGLYQVAKSMFANPRQNVDDNDRLTAVQIFHALADGYDKHILSMVQLGFAYAEEDKSQAIQYFVQAGEDGPHQASLYNAGRLLAEQGMFPSALWYMREAVSLHETYPEYTSEKMTETARAGYNSLHSQLQQVELGLEEMVHMFPYSDMNGFPLADSQADKLWHEAMSRLESFGTTNKISDLEAGVKKLSELQMQNDENMSALQTSLLRRILTIVLDKMNAEL